MSRLGGPIAGAALCIVFGVATAYTTLQPELKKQQEEKQGNFQEQHHQERSDTAISEALASDFREAREQVRDTGKKGALWGVREALFGKPPASQPLKAQQDGVQSPVNGSLDAKKG